MSSPPKDVCVFEDWEHGPDNPECSGRTALARIKPARYLHLPPIPVYLCSRHVVWMKPGVVYWDTRETGAYSE